VTSKSGALEVFAGADSNERTHLLRSEIDAAGPLTLLVVNRTATRYEVLLPVRPNGSTGWVRASDVVLGTHPWRITIELSSFRLTLYRGGALVSEFPIGVGKGNTPTPGGRYYTKELLKPPNPNGGYGPYAYGLSGFSNVLTSFNGGTGVIGIHGTNRPELIGQNVSSGCIRMRNEDITTLAKLLPLGVPVEIIA
jgi:lipoprotein-anchoring transpeptidase ErfK/SrfK